MAGILELENLIVQRYSIHLLDVCNLDVYLQLIIFLNVQL